MITISIKISTKKETEHSRTFMDAANACYVRACVINGTIIFIFHIRPFIPIFGMRMYIHVSYGNLKRRPTTLNKRA